MGKKIQQKREHLRPRWISKGQHFAQAEQDINELPGS